MCTADIGTGRCWLSCGKCQRRGWLPRRSPNTPARASMPSRKAGGNKANSASLSPRMRKPSAVTPRLTTGRLVSAALASVLRRSHGNAPLPSAAWRSRLSKRSPAAAESSASNSNTPWLMLVSGLTMPACTSAWSNAGSCMGNGGKSRCRGWRRSQAVSSAKRWRPATSSGWNTLTRSHRRTNSSKASRAARCSTSPSSVPGR